MVRLIVLIGVLCVAACGQPCEPGDEACFEAAAMPVTAVDDPEPRPDAERSASELSRAGAYAYDLLSERAFPELQLLVINSCDVSRYRARRPAKEVVKETGTPASGAAAQPKRY
jgi:hypothetical protein